VVLVLSAVLQVSAGGLVSALMGVGNFQTKWIGWPGAHMRSGQPRAAPQLRGWSGLLLLRGLLLCSSC